MTRDRSDGARVTWRDGCQWHRLRFEPLDRGGWVRIEETKRRSAKTWRRVGSEIVAEVDVDRPVATSDAGP